MNEADTFVVQIELGAEFEDDVREAAEAGADYVLVVDEGSPQALIEIAEATVPASEATMRTEPTVETVTVDMGGGVDDVELDVVRFDVGSVVVGEDPPNLVFFGGVEELARGTVTAFAADTQLPGPPDDPGDPLVTLWCAYGHRVRQRRSSPNRLCAWGHTLSS